MRVPPVWVPGDTGGVEFLAEVWRRAIVTQPEPDAAVSLGLAAAALASVVFAWPAVRMLVTVCHEAGHAVVATLTGRTLTGIRLHSDTSGLTVSRGRPAGPGMAATMFAGYPAASMVGLGGAFVVGAGHGIGMLWLFVGLLALMLLKIRNLYGALVVVGLGVLLGAASWYAPSRALSWLAYALVWLLVLAGPRPVLELARRRSPTSDAAQLARLTRVPQVLWVAAWLVITVGSLALAAPRLLPGVFG